MGQAPTYGLLRQVGQRWPWGKLVRQSRQRAGMMGGMGRGVYEGRVYITICMDCNSCYEENQV